MYGTCFPEEFVQSIVDIWEDDLKEGAMILTTSYSLESFSKTKRIQKIQERTFDFVWGFCTVYIHLVRDIVPDTSISKKQY